jgi:hypothetical protein
MHATDIVAYTYQAETLCPACTLYALNVPVALRAEQSCESILETLAVARGIDIFNERTFDSGDFPKVVFADQLNCCDEHGLDREQLCDGCDAVLI